MALLLQDLMEKAAKCCVFRAYLLQSCRRRRGMLGISEESLQGLCNAGFQRVAHFLVLTRIEAVRNGYERRGQDWEHMGVFCFKKCRHDGVNIFIF